jgi:hypothetical protein
MEFSRCLYFKCVAGQCNYDNPFWFNDRIFDIDVKALMAVILLLNLIFFV